jgi:hypothetical protein
LQRNEIDQMINQPLKQIITSPSKYFLDIEDMDSSEKLYLEEQDKILRKKLEERSRKPSIKFQLKSPTLKQQQDNPDDKLDKLKEQQNAFRMINQGYFKRNSTLTKDLDKKASQ